jgi:hypothetical protein
MVANSSADRDFATLLLLAARDAGITLSPEARE